MISGLSRPAHASVYISSLAKIHPTRFAAPNRPIPKPRSPDGLLNPSNYGFPEANREAYRNQLVVGQV